nr:unnamed protein product [Callosobruchus chinensis]
MDDFALRSKWEKWKRSLEIYFEAASITDAAKKKALLLHNGGSSLQEIYFSLPEIDADNEEDNRNVYEKMIQQLNNYFAPKQSRIYERHVFRSIQQEPNEKFDNFLLKLRRQATKCQFTNVEEHIIDQIVEKCNSEKLRRRILEMDDSKTLTDIITAAKSLETVQSQMDKYNSSKPDNTSSEINKIKENPRTNRCSKPGPSGFNKVECFRCGFKGHSAKDVNCPARNKSCLQCGRIGHFKIKCKLQKGFKRNNQETNHQYSPTKKKKTTENINLLEDNSSEEYIFHLEGDDKMTCTLGGVKMDFVIDSGSKSNIISESTWRLLKEKQVKITNQEKRPDKVFRSYANPAPLLLLGSFEAKFTVANKETNAKFYVVKNGQADLLGKETAIKLGVLQIGLNILEIKEESSKTPFPKMKGISIDIPIDNNVLPVIQPLRRILVPLEEKVDKQLNKLLQSDIIEPVDGHSEWISPIVPILKSDGEVRICVDMRRANRAILRENHPLPTMNTFLPKLRKARFFSKLDVKQAFHQIEISPRSRHITTFITHKGLFRYKRLLFGISCAPEIYQKVTERMIARCEGCFNFIDDFLVFGETEEEHDARLNKLMETLKSNNVLLNVNKCTFRVIEVEFLGHILTRTGIKPSPSKVEAIKSFRKPENTTELRSFLGLINYVGNYVPNLATITEPLRRALKEADKENTIVWKKEQQMSFDRLKEELSNDKYLGYYCPTAKTQLIADASPVGLGAILIQLSSSGEPRVIAYGNKALSTNEKNFCQTEKEALALVWAVEHFHIYLYGKEFELITDHKPLQFIFTPTSKPCARVERWVLRLQCYRYKVIYRPGKSNIADPLSRLCTNVKSAPFEKDEHVRRIVESSMPVAVSLSEIQQLSKTDEEILQVKEGLYKDVWSGSANSYKIFQHKLCFSNDILLRGNRIVIPKLLRERVLKLGHEGHPGIVCMKRRLRTKVWWPNLGQEAENLTRKCKGCTLVSAPGAPEPLKRREFPIHPWADVAIDYLGPLPEGYYILVIVDYFSRYMEVETTKTITTDKTILILRKICTRLGYPYSITADNGPQFGRSTEFKKFCEANNIKLFTTIPYWPQQNGEVERQNRSLVKRLKISKALGNDWKLDLQDYLLMYHNTPHPSTGKTPAELFFGRKLKDKLPMITDLNIEEEVRDKDSLVKQKGKEYADKRRHARDSEITEGDTVILKRMRKENKLDTTFDATPHTVISKNGGDVTAKNDVTGEEVRRNVLHMKRVGNEWKIASNDD